MTLIRFWLFLFAAFGSHLFALHAQGNSMPTTSNSVHMLPLSGSTTLGFIQASGRKQLDFQLLPNRVPLSPERLIFGYQLDRAGLLQSETRPKRAEALGHKSLSAFLSSRAMPQAFFCKLELKIDRASQMNCRFRLGSVDYVDALEGKRPTY